MFTRASMLRIDPPERRALFAADGDFRIVETDFGPHALYRPGLSRDPKSIDWLTDYEVSTLANSPVWGEHAHEGACCCDTCGYRRPHRARWPEDAFYLIEHKGQTLWAWNRAAAQVLADFVAAADKSALLQSGWGNMLKRVPTHFLTAQNRGAVEKKLRRLLEATP